MEREGEEAMIQIINEIRNRTEIPFRISCPGLCIPDQTTGDTRLFCRNCSCDIASIAPIAASVAATAIAAATAAAATAIAAATAAAATAIAAATTAATATAKGARALRARTRLIHRQRAATKHHAVCAVNRRLHLFRRNIYETETLPLNDARIRNRPVRCK
jgi:hypothetical protein